MKDRILIIDDDLQIRELIGDILSKKNYYCFCCESGEQAIERIKREPFDLILLDVRLPGKSGIDFLPDFKHYLPNTPILIITGYVNVDEAVKAMKMGAFDYIKKPFKTNELLLSIEKGLRWQKLLNENDELKMKMEEKYNFKGVIGKSKKIRKIIETIKQISNTNVNILITGESGTGKDLIARAIHYSGIRRDKPFVPINCSSLPDTLLESKLFGYKRGAFTGAYKNKDGLFKIANQGTIFLDEIGDMPLNLQAKILKVLDNGEFLPLGASSTLKTNARIISATNKNLQDLIDKRLFREDLFYRINVVNIEIPPLRERKEDIMILIDYFIEKHSRIMKKTVRGIDEVAMETLLRYYWPGNVRELENVIESSIALSQKEIIDVNTLPDHIFKTHIKHMDNIVAINKSLKETLSICEKQYIEEILRFCNGNISKAAQLAGIARQNMHLKLKHYKINVNNFRKQ